MIKRFLSWLRLVPLLVSLQPLPGAALTIGEFRAICATSGPRCEQVPVLQAYVGGSLDMIATLDERTDYLSTVYCQPPKQLFDVPLIIRHLASAEVADEDANAMSLVVDYLVTHGGC